ncbi:MAG: c-type cytochrome [Gammaproteobacteria bacterium]|nr:c-type cytochrome [Gammaproteobacteria bacterium]
MKTIAITLISLLISSITHAESLKLAPADLEIGEEINETCAGCHGEYAEGGKDGEYPRLAGLPASYIENQLRLFRDQTRPNIPMLEYLNKGQLPEQEIVDVSGYLSSIQLVTKLPPLVEGPDFDAYERMMMTKKLLNIAKLDGDTTAGKKLYNKECRSCHGSKAEGKTSKGIPMLAGQYTKYLKRQVQMFIDKKRIHDIEEPDEELLVDFSPQELDNIFAYLSILDDE